MSTLGDNIAALRKNKGLTQEKLAETIGISAQSVSKWENDVSMPDITLLPVLADIFSVSIDALFSASAHIDVSNENIPTKSFDSLLNSIAALWNITAGSEEYNKYFSIIKEDNNIQTAVFTDSSGAVWANQNLAVIFRKNPSEFAKSLGKLSENSHDILEAFTDSQLCEILSVMLINPINYSAAYLSKKCSLSLEITESALEKLNSIGFVSKTPSMVDNEQINIWNVKCTHKLLFVYTMLLMAGKIKDGDNYYCYYGSPTWCF